MLSLACGDQGPTGNRNFDQDGRHTPRRTITVADGLSDGITELHVDVAAGEISITDAGGGNPIYLEYDETLYQEMLGTVLAIQTGDLNYDAMTYLSPWENQGGEPERSSGPPQSDEKRSQKNAFTGPVLVRPAGNVRASRLLTPFDALLSGEWDQGCPAIAEAIGNSRLEHYSARSSVFSSLRGVQGIPATRLQWRNGKPYVTLQDIRNIYISLGVSMAEVAVKATQLDIMRVMYNGHNCQQPIVIQPPSPGTVYVPPSSGGGGGSGMNCYYQTEWWEISYDGGGTWYPFPVEKYICIAAQ